MKFHLTYEGILLGASRSNTRASHKHEIRKVFHLQMRRLWEISPRLNDPPGQDGEERSFHGKLGKYDMFGRRFVPLIDESDGVNCSLKILLLRSDAPGPVVKSGDLDNRIKTLLDALRLPQNSDEISGDPSEEDTPFFCLLRDDALIESLSIKADALLQPIAAVPNSNDARLVIEVQITPYTSTWTSMSFL
ncbi:hypothetical protein [Pseudorhizobium flavum]|uniref:hypothetical protein n=1 Tax=Pseudorhizobium flavum TaxID=1335061 RepID=UPI0024938053|nr:hypothetical protein [Pseudorhizobium flavum]